MIIVVDLSEFDITTNRAVDAIAMKNAYRAEIEVGEFDDYEFTSSE